MRIDNDYYYWKQLLLLKHPSNDPWNVVWGWLSSVLTENINCWPPSKATDLWESGPSICIFHKLPRLFLHTLNLESLKLYLWWWVHNVLPLSVVFIFWPDFRQWGGRVWARVSGMDELEFKGFYECQRHLIPWSHRGSTLKADTKGSSAFAVWALSLLRVVLTGGWYRHLGMWGSFGYQNDGWSRDAKGLPCLRSFLQ